MRTLSKRRRAAASSGEKVNCLSNFECLERRELLAAVPMISEFLARNDGGLRDGFGRSSDWIELHNPGDQTINLAGYRLTDDPGSPSKWVFPDSSLPAGGYEIVFASGQDATDVIDSDGHHHTNFTLKRGGDYLGLISPDGTVVSEFGRDGGDFPEQQPNVSYGQAQSKTLLSGQSEVAYLVPFGTVNGDWTARDFDPAANGFSFGPAAIGFESRPNSRNSFVGEFQTELADRTHGVYVRAEFELGDPSAINALNLRMKYDNGFALFLNGTKVLSENAPDQLTFFSTALNTGPRDGTALQFQEFDLAEFTDLLVGGKNILAVHVLNSRQDDNDMLFVPELTAGSSDVSAAFGQDDKIGFMTTLTPGEANVSSAEVYEGFVADTRFSVDRGIHDEAFSLEITTETENAKIYFSTNGSIPSPDNPEAILYSEPIVVDSTSTIRAAAHLDGFIPSNTDTQTYLFLDDVIQQDPPVGDIYPETWQTRTYSGDYAMDPEVVAAWDDNNPDNDDFGIREALGSLPTLSIVMDHDDLWDERNGIYNHATNEGEGWRRAGSVEYFDPATGDEFQVDAGIQMHGNASRDNLRTKKHSFRILFQSDFGPTTLDFPLFQDSEIEQINTVVLKSFFTDGFPTRTVQGRYSPLESQYLRDTWMRDSQLAMGQLSAHSEYAHLYINGLYWGLYSPTERPDEAFLAEYLGGDREDYDIIKDFNELFAGQRTAWNQLFSLANAGLAGNADYQRIQGNNPDGTDNPDLPNLLDVEHFIDYMLLHLYAGAEDWPHHNWYAARNRVGETTGFKFYTWDQELAIDQFFHDRTERNENNSPGRLFQTLRSNDEFRLHFADRIQKHLFHGGALSVEANQDRWMRRANQIEKAIIAESARWGDAREGERGTDGVIVPTMTVDQWRAERDRVRDVQFEQSRSVSLNRFRADGLFPSTQAPSLNQHGGVVSDQFDITLTAPEGTIYYTLDGTDPRVTGGGVSPTALIYTQAIRFSANSTLAARVLSGNEWSPLTEAKFVIESTLPLRVSEINYRPHDPNLVPGLEEADEDEGRFEFIELTNIGQDPIDLEGVRFVNSDVNRDRQGIRFRFAPQQLAPDERLVVVRDREAFQSRYGNQIGIAAGDDGDDGPQGEYAGALSNEGERLTLVDASGAVIQQFSYGVGNDWHDRANGNGSSLVVVDPTASYSTASNWRPSIEFGGSPGRTDRQAAEPVVISEVLASAEDSNDDFVELRNLGDRPVDVSGWYLSDRDDELFKHRLPDATRVSPGGFHVAPGGELNFELNGRTGGDVRLLATDEQGRPTHFVDHVAFGPSGQGLSAGPWPDVDSRFVTLSGSTPGAPNRGPWIGEVVISEIHYQPLDPDGHRELTSEDYEFVELYNQSDSTISLAGWQITGDVQYVFNSQHSLAPNETVALIRFDPSDASLVSAFQFTFNMPGGSKLAGPLLQSLPDEGGVLRVVRPADFGDGDTSATILVDEVQYGAMSPWPAEAGGLGSSIHRIHPSEFGSSPDSWDARAPSPNVVDIVARQIGDSNDDGIFNQLDIVQILQANKYLTGLPARWSEGDWNSDGVFDQLDVIEVLQAGTYLARQ